LMISSSDLTKPENSKKFIQYFLIGTGLPTHIPNTSAITQFKNTGSLRLVSYRKGVVDSILGYDSWNQLIIKHNDFLTETQSEAFAAIYPIADIKIFKDSSYSDFFKKTLTNKQTPPLHLSQEKLNIFLGYETRHVLTCQVNRGYLENQLRRATRLINFFKEEYHLDKE